MKAWNKMEELDLRPPSSQVQHYLWALAFLRRYPPNNNTLLRLLGGKDPKTTHKYMWPYIKSLAELENFCHELIAFVAFVSINYYSHFVVPHNRLILTIGRKETS